MAMGRSGKLGWLLLTMACQPGPTRTHSAPPSAPHVAREQPLSPRPDAGVGAELASAPSPPDASVAVPPALDAGFEQAPAPDVTSWHTPPLDAGLEQAPPPDDASRHARITKFPESCQQARYAPDCSAAFPARVACPASFSDVPVEAYCGMEGTTKRRECTYPEGRCRCAHTPYCGGAYPTLLQQAGMRWQCFPPRAANDCPDAASPGQACKLKGQECSYGGCGVTTRCRCSGGVYRCSAEHWAPPPSARPMR